MSQVVIIDDAAPPSETEPDSESNCRVVVGDVTDEASVPIFKVIPAALALVTIPPAVVKVITVSVNEVIIHGVVLLLPASALPMPVTGAPTYQPSVVMKPELALVIVFPVAS